MIKEAKIKKLSKESELNFYFEEALKDPHTRIEFIRKGRGDTPRQKVGVMISCIDPIEPSKVIIGFTLCNLKYDDFDYVNWGIQEAKDFGKKVAHRRAFKNRDKSGWHVYCCPKKDIEIETALDVDQIVYIPQSVHESLQAFVFNSYKYYKDKSFPVWVENYFPKTVFGEDEEEEDMTNGKRP